MGHGSQLVANELRQPDVLVGAGASPLNHEIVLHSVPGESVVVARARERENPRGHQRCHVAAQSHHERTAAARRRHRHTQADVGAEGERDDLREKLGVHWR